MEHIFKAFDGKEFVSSRKCQEYERENLMAVVVSEIFNARDILPLLHNNPDDDEGDCEDEIYARTEREIFAQLLMRAKRRQGDPDFIANEPRKRGIKRKFADEDEEDDSCLE